MSSGIDDEVCILEELSTMQKTYIIPPQTPERSLSRNLKHELNTPDTPYNGESRKVVIIVS